MISHSLSISVKNISAVVVICGLSGCATHPAADSAIAPMPQIQSRAPDSLIKPRAASAPLPEPAGVLTLREVLVLALRENPELAPYAWQTRADEARILQAGLQLNPELSLQVEDIVGTGSLRGAREAQTTLQLSQVIELGGKRTARTEVASQARGITRSEYELKRVEVLGDVTLRFIQVVANQHALGLAQTDRQLTETALRIVQERVAAGRGSALEERKAQVALARAELLVEGATHELNAARKKLAASWRSTQPAFERAEADLFARKVVPPFDELMARIARGPEFARWVSEQRLRDA